MLHAFLTLQHVLLARDSIYM